MFGGRSSVIRPEKKTKITHKMCFSCKKHEELLKNMYEKKQKKQERSLKNIPDDLPLRHDGFFFLMYFTIYHIVTLNMYIESKH